MSMRVFCSDKSLLSFLPAPSIQDTQGTGYKPYSSHGIKRFVRSQFQANKIGVVASKKIDEVQSKFFPKYFREGKQGIKLRLRVEDTMKDDTNAESRI